MSEQPYHVSRFRKALVHFIGGRAAQAIARAILLLVLVRILEIKDYGAYMLIIGLAETLLQIASLGILPVGQRYLPQMLTTLPARKLYGFVSFLTLSQLLILVLITAALFRYWPIMTPYMGMSEAQTISTQSAVWLFLLIPAFRFSAEMLDALLEQGKAQIARALMPTLRVIGVVAIIVGANEITLEQIFWVDIGATAFCLALAWLMLSVSLGKLHNRSGDGIIPLREMLKFGWHMAGTGLLGATASPGALRLILANALGIAESGVFAFLQSLQRLVGRYLPGTLLRGLVRPILVNRSIGQQGLAILEAGTGLLLKSNLIIVATGTVAIAVAGDLIVDIASGGKFPNAGLTLLLMFIALAITSQRTVIEMVMQITGHTATLRATALVAPIALAAVWLFADYGLNIAVMIIAFGSALSNWIAMAVLVRSREEFSVDWRGFAAVTIPAMLLAASGYVLAGSGYVPAGSFNTLALATLGMLMFVAVLGLTRPLRAAELDIVRKGAGQTAARIMKRFASA